MKIGGFLLQCVDDDVAAADVDESCEVAIFYIPSGLLIDAAYVQP